MRLVRVAVNVEQFLYRTPGGIGRYTAKLVTLLPQLFPDVSVAPFTARHRPEEVEAAWQTATGTTGMPATSGMATGTSGTSGTTGTTRAPVRLPLPRPVLYEAWNTAGWPPLRRLAPALAGIDLVHAPSVAVPPRDRVPLVVTVHDVAPALFPEAFPRHGRWFHARGLAAAARRADLVITVSQAAAAEIAAHTKIPAERVRVVPNGVDHVLATAAEVAAARRHHGLEAPYLLWCGTVEPRKNLATLVHAFADLVGSGRAADHLLVLAGPAGWLSDDLIPASVRDRLGERVRLLGQLAEADLRALYAGATVFALPSRHEGFGLPVLEAMVQGTPVLAADIAALREVAGGAARLVAPDRRRGVGRRPWRTTIADDGARRDLAEAGRTRAAAFSWEHTVRLTHAVYSEVLAGGR